MSYPAPGAADDASLLLRYARAGDAAAFAELVGRYADFVYATARRVTGSAPAAEDVAQDCFLRLAQRSAEIRGSVAAWLHRATVNRALEWRRSESARKRREARTAASADAQASGDDGESARIIALVDEAMAELPDELRVVLTEHFLHGRSQVDLAASLGVSQPTISRRIEKGIGELRERLRRSGAVPAVSGLALLLANLPASPAPRAVKAAATKIGLSGVRLAPPVSGGGGLAMKVAAGVAGVAIGLAAAFFYHRSPPAPTPGPAAAASRVPGTTPSAASTRSALSRVIDELDDIGDTDDDDEDDDDAEGRNAPAAVAPAAGRAAASAASAGAPSTRPSR